MCRADALHWLAALRHDLHIVTQAGGDGGSAGQTAPSTPCAVKAALVLLLTAAEQAGFNHHQNPWCLCANPAQAVPVHQGFCCLAQHLQPVLLQRLIQSKGAVALLKISESLFGARSPSIAGDVAAALAASFMALHGVIRAHTALLPGFPSLQQAFSEHWHELMCACCFMLRLLYSSF